MTVICVYVVTMATIPLLQVVWVPYKISCVRFSHQVKCHLGLEEGNSSNENISAILSDLSLSSLVPLCTYPCNLTLLL